MNDSVDAVDLRIPGFGPGTPIGAGGFGSVYRARQARFDRVVAVKIAGARHLDATSQERFEREVQAMGRLSDHPAIVTVHEAGVTGDGLPYIVMAYEARGSLADRLRRDGPIGWEQALDIGVRIASALATAHRAGVLHRDVKPANILVSSYGEPKLGDFGIARLGDSTLTRTGEVSASIPFAAPEVLGGGRPSEASDVYSLGATLSCLIAGRAPFAASDDGNVLSVLSRVLREPPPDHTGMGVPPEVDAFLHRAMAKDPALRPPTAVACAEELRALQSSLGHPATPLIISRDAAAVGAAEGTLSLDLAGETGAGHTATMAVDTGGPHAAAPEADDAPRGRSPRRPLGGRSLAALGGLGVAAAVTMVLVLLLTRSSAPGGQTASTSSSSSSAGTVALADLLLTPAQVAPVDGQARGEPNLRIGAAICGNVATNGLLDQAGAEIDSDTVKIAHVVGEFDTADHASAYMDAMAAMSASCPERQAGAPAEPRLGDDTLRVVLEINGEIYRNVYVRSGRFVTLVSVDDSSNPAADFQYPDDLASKALALISSH